VLKVAAAVLGFVGAGLIVRCAGLPEFSSEEAMETAQLARNLARGKGYTTQSIRPLSIYLLRSRRRRGRRRAAPSCAGFMHAAGLSGFIGGVDGRIAVRFRRHSILVVRAGTMDRRLQSGFVFRGGAAVVSHCPPDV
jgi:hypothetical protein